MRLPEGGSLLEILEGLGLVDLDADAVLINAAEGVVGLGLSVVGTSLEPGNREVLVGLDAVALKQALSLQPELVALVAPLGAVPTELRGIQQVVGHG